MTLARTHGPLPIISQRKVSKIAMQRRRSSDGKGTPPAPQGSGADGRHSSRISTGRDLLPNEDGRTRWARLLRATYRALIEHCGGEEIISDVQRMACRRIGALEAELVHIEDRLARLRRSRKEPPASLLATYAALTAQQHRLSKEIGWHRASKVRDITPPTPREYLRSRTIDHDENEIGFNGHRPTRAGHG